MIEQRGQPNIAFDHVGRGEGGWGVLTLPAMPHFFDGEGKLNIFFAHAPGAPTFPQGRRGNAYKQANTPLVPALGWT